MDNQEKIKKDLENLQSKKHLIDENLYSRLLKEIKERLKKLSKR